VNGPRVRAHGSDDRRHCPAVGLSSAGLPRTSPWRDLRWRERGHQREPGEVNIVTGSGLLGRLLGSIKDSGVRLAASGSGMPGTDVRGAEPRTWSFNSLLHRGPESRPREAREDPAPCSRPVLAVQRPAHERSGGSRRRIQQSPGPALNRSSSISSGCDNDSSRQAS